ncbi:MAG TPA: chemotaxis protein CheW [Acidobacteriota bacterium]|nr:chemotaxis protein CheW [Acidobacteriota bacterium]
MDLLSFHYLDETYCIKVTDVHEVISSVDPVQLPRVPEPFEGVFHHRGNVFSLLSFTQCMARLSGIVSSPATKDSQVVLFSEPYHQFALRVPGLIETTYARKRDITVVTAERFSAPILDGIVNKGEERYYLISAMKLFLHAGRLISEIENSRKIHSLNRQEG